MKTIGLIGGTSWVSTVDYYRLINELTNQQAGGLHAARLILYSINFGEIKPLLDANDWDRIAEIYCDIAIKLKQAGAECIALAANTPHLIAGRIEKAAGLPLIHIAAVTAKAIAEKKLRKAALLGTRFTMESDFYKEHLSAQGIETMIPGKEDRAFIHESIFAEMARNIFTEATRTRYLQIIDKLVAGGADGIIYACTEIPILLKDDKVNVPTFDTTHIHAQAMVDFAMEK